MATQQDIQSLKDNWRSDPTWDIEDTEGFEAHREELLAYRKEWEKRWEQDRAEELSKQAAKMGIPNNPDLANYILSLQHRVDRLETQMNNHVGQH